MNHKKENLHVILVDDVEEEHLIFRKALSALPHLKIDFTCFSSANELQAYLENDSAIPHVIFLDMHMPEKNGLDCLREIRSSLKYSEVVVAMYSVSNADTIISKCLAAGANIYITKPHDFKQLTDRLYEVMKSCIHYHSLSMSFETFVKRF